MAKAGLEYFSFDVDFFQDEKIQFVSSRFGTIGEIITIKLLCRIYRNGYFVDWNDDSALLFAKSVGDNCQHSLVKDVVCELVKRGFFNKNILDTFGVLTSKGIQKRYFATAYKRRNIEIYREIMLIDEPIREGIYKTSYPLTSKLPGSGYPVDTLSKVKESKVNESKVNESKGKESNYASSEPLKLQFPGNVSLSDDEHNKLIAQYGAEEVRKMIDVLSNYKHSSGKKYKSDYHAILSWVAEKVTRQTPAFTKAATKDDVFYRIQKFAMEASANELSPNKQNCRDTCACIPSVEV